MSLNLRIIHEYRKTMHTYSTYLNGSCWFGWWSFLEQMFTHYLVSLLTHHPYFLNCVCVCGGGGGGGLWNSLDNNITLFHQILLKITLYLKVIVKSIISPDDNLMIEELLSMVQFPARALWSALGQDSLFHIASVYPAAK